MLSRIVRLVFPPKSPPEKDRSMKYLLDGKENPCHMKESAIVYHRPGFIACFWKKSNSISIKTWGDSKRIPLPKEDYLELQISVARLTNPRLARWYQMILQHLAEKAAKKESTRGGEMRPPLRIPGP